MILLLTLTLLAVQTASELSDADRLVPPDTVELGALRAAAAARDPRALQPEILERATRLRLANLRSERLPQLAVSGQATWQSDVPSVPIVAPDGSSLSAPREQGRIQVEADWALYDGGRTARRAEVERARLAEQTSGVAVTLHALREATTEAFFGALLYQAQAQTLALAVEDLDAQLTLTRRRAEEGAALAADAAAVEAELIRLNQRLDEAEADCRAALAVLEDLTGVGLGPETALRLPSLAVDADSNLVVEESGRPEFQRFASTRARAEAEARLAASAALPTLSVFGQAGLGRPSPFDFLSDEVKEYSLVGVRARWGWDWGRSRREAEAARLQSDIARTEADAFARTLLRETETYRADLDRLDAALVDDARAIVLREEVARVAQRRLDEGVLLAPDYVDAVTDLAEARLVAARHRIERVRAQTLLRSTLGTYPDLPSAAAITD